ncbi:MAG: exodeoxyribonuclease VII large subunit [Pseudomonadota bacterium]
MTSLPPLSVSQLINTLKSLLETSLPLVWVEGEISNLSRPASGHLYFTLKDAGAQVRCAMFRPRAGLLRIRPQDGMQVLLRARITLYEARGDLQLVVEHMEDAGLGALQRAFEMLKQRLSAEGLFDPAHKRTLPALPRRVGIITSPSGAALQDVLHVLARRFPLIPLRLYPSSVQGATAVKELIAALEQANAEQSCDVVLLVRGGGSLEDLQAFNDERLARAIHASSIPVISGVGHETDFSIADFVADARAPTPSAAAALAVPDASSVRQQLEHAAQRLFRPLRNRLESGAIHLDTLNRHLQSNHPRQRLARMGERLHVFAARLHHAQSRMATGLEHQLQSLNQRLQRRHPAQRIALMQARLAALSDKMQQTGVNSLHPRQAAVQQYAARLHILSPLATLSRGYAIVEDRGRALTHCAEVMPGQAIQARLQDGLLHCKVLDVEPASSETSAPVAGKRTDKKKGQQALF